jgi:hypothetical protein
VNRIFVIFLLFACILSGIQCASGVVVGAMPRDIDIQLKNLKPPDNKALIYVLRPEPVLRNKKIQITCDGQFIGFTRAGLYLAFLVDPGLHVFTSEDSIRIVNDFNAFYRKRLANKITILDSESKLERSENHNQAHLNFLKKHNIMMQCYRTQTCSAEALNRLFASKPMPLEMYHALLAQGGNTYYLYQTFRPGWSQPEYILTEYDRNRGQAFLKNLMPSRYVNPELFPRDYVKLSQNLN